jgi:hypothetical protein
MVDLKHREKERTEVQKKMKEQKYQRFKVNTDIKNLQNYNRGKFGRVS